MNDFNLAAPIAAQKLQEQHPQSYNEAVRIARHLAATHFSDVPDWKPLPTLMGVLSQIDNMTCAGPTASVPAGDAALVQLLNAALLHPESAEGYIRQVIETLSTTPAEAAPSSGDDRGCPCLYTTPCDERCTCVSPFSSRGCMRCCSYGSPEQQKAMAEWLVAMPEHVRTQIVGLVRDMANHKSEVEPGTLVLMEGDANEVADLIQRTPLEELIKSK